jgi:hypothetical protein
MAGALGGRRFARHGPAGGRHREICGRRRQGGNSQPRLSGDESVATLVARSRPAIGAFRLDDRRLYAAIDTSWFEPALPLDRHGFDTSAVPRTGIGFGRHSGQPPRRVHRWLWLCCCPVLRTGKHTISRPSHDEAFGGRCRGPYRGTRWGGQPPASVWGGARSPFRSRSSSRRYRSPAGAHEGSSR